MSRIYIISLGFLFWVVRNTKIASLVSYADGHVPNRKCNGPVIVVARGDNINCILVRLLKIFFIFLQYPFAVVSWVFISVWESIVELRIVRKSFLGYSRDVF